MKLFLNLIPPINHSQDYKLVWNSFYEDLVKEKDLYDIALCCCQEYNNLICASLYDIEKSAINVGNVILMYFGIYTDEIERLYPDVLKLYKNEYWSKLELEK